MTRKRRLYLFCTCILATIVGCGDDGGGDITGTGTTAPGSSTGTTTDATDGSTGSSSSESVSGTTGDASTGETGSTGDTDSESGDSSSGSSTGGAIPIPDPGDGMDQWYASGDVGSPDVAWPVGIATFAEPYVEGNTNGEGNAFFVFQAGPELTQITIVTGGGDTGPAEYVHLHDGTGGLFGEEIPPEDLRTWSLTPGNVYVLELHFTLTGFF